MKLLLLSDPNSVHTIKWAKSLSKKEIKILIFGLGDLHVDSYTEENNIEIRTLNQEIIRSEGGIEKIKYLKALPIIKKIIKNFKPNILHAHYASSYGLLGSLAGFSPFIVSVWGSDVYSFPKKSFLHKMIIKYNLKKADKILSTSKVMANETKKYTDKAIMVTPFGIDRKMFYPQKVTNDLFEEGDIIVGTIKTLEYKYGIEFLIKAFKILVDKHPKLPLKLLIVGGGSLYNELKMTVNELEIEKQVVFTGKVSYEEVPIFHNIISIFVSLSIFDSESFGVAILEASASGKAVVVTNVGGLPEVVDDGCTGFVVPKENSLKAAGAIESLVLDENLNRKMGKSGINRVEEFYDWGKCVDQMLSIYKEYL